MAFGQLIFKDWTPDQVRGDRWRGEGDALLVLSSRT